MKINSPKIGRQILIALMLLVGILYPAAATETFEDEPSVTLKSIRQSDFMGYLRVVFDFDEIPIYTAARTNEVLTICIEAAAASEKITNFHEINDPFLSYIEVQKENDDLIIKIPFYYPLQHDLFGLDGPPRLVVDLDRNFKKVVQEKEVQKGIKLVDLKAGSKAGIFNAHVLHVERRHNKIFPALAPKSRKNFFQTLSAVFLPWFREEAKPFGLAKVSQITKHYKAVAGINGTYFARGGLPLGILMIDGELISYPIYERTALVFTESGRAYVDNITIKSYFHNQKGFRYDITGINSVRPEDGITIFTPTFGPRTNTPHNGLEMTVVEDKITKITLGNSEIPQNGYVLSATGASIEHLYNNTLVSEKIDLVLNLFSFNETIDAEVTHLIGGGPRLVKKGQIYVTKRAEKFRRDITVGRKSRSAVGITKDNNLIFVTVDGPRRRSRKNKSVGANLEELADLMLYLGSYDAMNLDGGGSATLVVNNKVINQPSGGSERRVSNALLVKPK